MPWLQIDWTLADIRMLLVFGLFLIGFDVLSKAHACLIVTFSRTRKLAHGMKCQAPFQPFVGS